MLTPSHYAKSLALKKIFNSFPKPMLLVDAGCSNGFHLRKIDADRKVGLDLNPTCLKIDVDIIKCDIRTIPLKDNIANCIMSLDVIEHILEDGRVMDEFHRVLANGGMLVLTTPNDSEFLPYKPLRRLLNIDTVAMHRKWGHMKPGYSKAELSNVAIHHGFNIMSCRSIYQPLVQVLDLPYTLFLSFLDRNTSSPETVGRLRENMLIAMLEKIHDFFLRVIMAWIITRIESRGRDGFLHLVVFTKNHVAVKGYFNNWSQT